MRLLWEDRALEDYLYWQTQDKKTLKRINALIGEIKRAPFEGMMEKILPDLHKKGAYLFRL